MPRRLLLVLAAGASRSPEAARALRTVIFLVLLAETTAARAGRGRPTRTVRPTARAAPAPRRRPRASRGALAGRRPRG